MDDASSKSCKSDQLLAVALFTHQGSCSPAVCSLAILVYSTVYMDNGHLGDSQDRKKWRKTVASLINVLCFLIAFIRSKWDQSELIKNV